MKKRCSLLAFLFGLALPVVAAEFSPSGEPSATDPALVLWLRADRAVQADDAGKVTAWNDAAAGPDQAGDNSASPIVTSGPALIESDPPANDQPGLSFGDQDAGLELANSKRLFSGEPFAIFVVAREFESSFTSSQAGVMLAEGANIFYSNFGRLAFQRGGNPFEIIKCNEYVAREAPVLRVLARTSDTEWGTRIFSNGKLASDGNAIPALPAGSSATIGYQMLSGRPDRFFQGIIYEILVYRGEITDDLIERVSRYLTDRYGIVLRQAGDRKKMNEGETVADAAVVRNPAMAEIKDVPGLPRVLLIGDSISIGYTLQVRKALESRANVHRIPDNGATTAYGLQRLNSWLGGKPWDVIHFNFGLHDAKYLTETETKVSRADYEKNLQEIVRRLKATGAKVVFATTTPVPAVLEPPGRRFDAIPDRNEIAVKVMKENGVRVDDLYAVVFPRQGELQHPKDVHYESEGYALLAKAVAASIESELPNHP